MNSKNASPKKSVPVSDLLEAGESELRMELMAGKSGLGHKITEAAVNRPGLALSGFFEHFAHKRIQVFGLAEYAYLSSLSEEERRKRLESFFKKKIPCVVVARGKRVFPEMIDFAEKFGVPVMRSKLITRLFINAATIMLENLMLPHCKVQGTMIEILGIGVLIEGKAGIGKSETALALIRNGASLVADDITSFRRDTYGQVHGSPVAVTRYHMEIRGLGIIHVPSLFGVASVREEKVLDLVATLTHECNRDDEDRSRSTEKKKVILGAEVPQVVIEVVPGRDVANLVETAALDMKLRRLGHDAAKELDEKLVAVLMGGE